MPEQNIKSFEYNTTFYEFYSGRCHVLERAYQCILLQVKVFESNRAHNWGS